MKSNERGVILIVVALTIMTLMTLSAFVVDFGVLWMARSQAQNAADAGALAGATALVYDDSTNVTASGPAYVGASTVATTNSVFGGAQGVEVFVDPAAAWTPPAPAICSGGGCVQVNVYQDGTHSSATLPTYFARIFSVGSQGIKATATARAMSANSSKCVRPWMLPDQWQDNVAPSDQFNPGDVYVSPIPGPGTGYTLADVGDTVVFHPGDPKNAISPSDYYVVDIDPSCTGGNCYRDSIGTCTQVPVTIGGTLTTEPGNMQGPTKQGVGDLIALDPSATWNGTAVVNSSGTDWGSPRIFPLALFSPVQFSNLDRTSGRFDLTIVNMMGFFLSAVDNDGTVHGVLVRDPGDLVYGGPTPGPGAAFMQTPMLVR